MGQRILVVDDDAALRFVAVEAPKLEGYDTIEASSADETICALEAYSSATLVFSDVQIPGQMDGLGLAKWIASWKRT